MFCTFSTTALKNAKIILDKRIHSKKLRSGQFGARIRVESTPSTLPVPHNPVKWAIKRYTLIAMLWFIVIFTINRERLDVVLQGTSSDHHDWSV